ncbi:unnamed protein product [Cylicostephanus goldi]|uniref:Uncharacterized protein n=1 Tax=Cylicostephanus goldi TaxID=71465 RepID=A0A3P6RXH2_CYLGO|nr:unnamed protein product [Cylicostephanus goldi]
MWACSKDRNHLHNQLIDHRTFYLMLLMRLAVLMVVKYFLKKQKKTPYCRLQTAMDTRSKRSPVNFDQASIEIDVNESKQFILVVFCMHQLTRQYAVQKILLGKSY